MLLTLHSSSNIQTAFVFWLANNVLLQTQELKRASVSTEQVFFS